MNTYYDLHRLIDEYFPSIKEWFCKKMFSLSTQTNHDKYQLLLASWSLGISSYDIQCELRKITNIIDPPSGQLSHMVESFLRQLVLTKYDIAKKERKDFYTYWIDDKKLFGQNIVIVAYIMNLAAENIPLLSENAIEYASKWHLRHLDIQAPKVRAWFPRSLVLFGHIQEAKNLTTKILSGKEKNGSFHGGHAVTAAIVYSLLCSAIVNNSDVYESIKYILARLENGFTGDIALETTTIKILKTANLLNNEQEMKISREISRNRSVFISHSSEDHPFVKKLAIDLERLSVKVWVDEAEIKGGDSFIDKIENGLSDMQHLIIVLSRTSSISFWVKRELNYALVEKVEKQLGKVIPVITEDCDIPLLLRERHYIDFRKGYDWGLNKLLHAIDVCPAG